MSSKPPVTGRVQSMKSKFENLNSLEPLDISVLSIKKIQKNPYQFRRSSTSLDLTENNNNNEANSYKKNGTTDVQKHFFNESVRTNTDIHRQNSASFNIHRKNSNDLTTKNEAPFKENVEVVSRLTRHTSDPVKRGSIKRSPAFRVGDKPILKTNGHHKISSPSPPAFIASLPVIPDHLGERIESFLKRTVDVNVLYQPGITDTLKAALKQPLPTGPPPKKPPRAFVDSPSPKENISTLKLFEDKLAAVLEEQQNRTHTTIKEAANKNETEKSVRIKSSENHMEKSGPLSTKSLFGCIRSCASVPVYDTVGMYSDDDDDSVPKKHINIPKSNNPSEHIYMEPYGHLKRLPHSNCSAPELSALSGSPSLSESSRMDSLSSSNCACPEDHFGDNGDLHYLVSYFFV